jgi:branched-subunit amino acid ABC-type transport system permease component
VTAYLPFIVIGLAQGSVYGLAGNGLVLTYKTSGVFNFAHGTIAALAAYAFYDLRERHGVPWPFALAIVLLVIAPLVGMALEVMGRRLASAAVVMNVVATVGLLVALQQLAIIHYGAAAIGMHSFLPTSTFKVLGVVVGVDQVIVMLVGLIGMVALSWMFARTRIGRTMTAVVDQPDLLALMGTSPARVRRQAWIIGTSFAAMSGVLLAPMVGLDAPVLTLLVVQAFGAAAIGRFTSLPYTFLGGVILGVLANVSTKFVATHAWLGGVPTSLPFIILFAVLVLAPKTWLVDFTQARKQRVVEPRHLSPVARVVGGLLVVLLVWRTPSLVGPYLPVYTAGVAYVIIFLSLALLVRTSGQVSLGQLAFAAVGAVASSRLAAEAGVPWLLAVVIGALFAVPVGALLAIPAVRRSGLYLALATFGFAVTLQRLFFGTTLMFQARHTGSLPAPRPSFASGDNAYFYVVAMFLAAAVAFVTLLHRSRLGRLLRAMADSPTALNTYGTNVTAVKVIVFCVSAFLAGLGGALLGPITGSTGPANFESINSLLLLVVLVISVGSEITASIGAAAALMVIPSYITSETLTNYFPLLFGVAAVVAAVKPTELRAPGWLGARARSARKRPERHPALARVERPRRVAGATDAYADDESPHGGAAGQRGNGHVDLIARDKKSVPI